VITKILGNEPLISENVQQRNSEFGAYTEISSDNYFENSSLGDYSYTGPFCIIQNAEIGKFSNIAALVRIGPTAHPMNRATQHHFTYRRVKYGLAETDDNDFFNWRAEQKIVIGHDTWLGHGSIVLPNVTIGTGAVLGAGAIATKPIPPYAVAVGNPAKVIKYRFPDSIVDQLLKIKWWNWSHEQIKERIDDFSKPIEEFLEIYDGN
jgi:phosphonate metabolism protein (transferase hexapeptide repeat family)